MILTVSLNSALQKVMVFDDYCEGQVMRAKELHESASGKGINAARAVANLGGQALSVGLVGGSSGLLMKSMLKKEGIKEDLTMCSGNTRTCVTVVNRKNSSSTELIEPSSRISAPEFNEFRRTFQKHLKKAKITAISGTLPPGCAEDTYAELFKDAEKAGVPVCADIWGKPLLAALKGKIKPLLVKMNTHEFKDTFGERKLQDVLTGLLDSGLGMLVVTFGKDGLVAGSKQGIMLAMPPKITPVNAIGAGDSMLGGFCRAIDSGLDPEGIIRAGTGAAAASTLSLLPAAFTAESAAENAERTTVKKL